MNDYPRARWIKNLETGKAIPPFCVEVAMKDGSRHFLHSGGYDAEGSSSLTFRIWDLRALSEDEYDQVKEGINRSDGLDGLPPAEDIHPKLDWAIIWAHESDVAYVIEWHDRNWPVEQRDWIGFQRGKVP